jgi:hypothetical protein
MQQVRGAAWLTLITLWTTTFPLSCDRTRERRVDAPMSGRES